MFEYRPYEDEGFVIGFIKDDKTFEALFHCFNEHNAAKLAEMLNKTADVKKAPTRQNTLPGQMNFKHIWN